MLRVNSCITGLNSERREDCQGAYH